jgi:hypothetical protein
MTIPRVGREAAGVVSPDGALPILRSQLLADLPWVVLGFTRRVAGLGSADGNIGYSAPRDQSDAWTMRQQWASAIGVDPEQFVTTGQVHGANVVRVETGHAGQGARPGSGRVGLADAMITDAPNVALLSLHADCLPIFLVDPVRRAIGVVHAGWRGTVVDVAGAAVRAMAESWGSEPGELLAVLGPAIGPCCYEVGAEVVDAWSARAGDRTTLALHPPRRNRSGDGGDADQPSVHLDLAAANALLLNAAGVGDDQIERLNICTRCDADAWFSHRAQGATTGRFGAVIAIAN